MFQGLLVRRFDRAISVAFSFALAASLSLPASPAFAAVDLIGTWFMVIHYKDSMTANPDSDRWEDKVWKIEKKGSRLQWSEYPIVVFNDGSGRFGRVGGNPRARLLVKWEPNNAQMREILDGPQVNSRGSKKKTLRGSPKRGYASSSKSRSVSAMTFGYRETWTIENPVELPVFIRDDALGTESALATNSDKVVSGRTRYATLEISEDGNLLTGTYARDENKKGTFKLIRAGDARGIESDGRTPNEKAADRAADQFQQGVREVAYRQFLETLGKEQGVDLQSQLSDGKLKSIWGKYEERIIAGDERAKVEIGEELREAYIESVQAELQKSLASGDPDALLSAEAKGVPPEKIELMRKVRESLGEEKIASLRAEYGDRIRAGDEEAMQAMRDEIRKAYVASLEQDVMKR